MLTVEPPVVAMAPDEPVSVRLNAVPVPTVMLAAPLELVTLRWPKPVQPLKSCVPMPSLELMFRVVMPVMVAVGSAIVELSP